MPKRILVVGSVHADIVATYNNATSENRDKIGEIRISVGGAAFNVASNLAYDGIETWLYTHIREQSLTSSMIRSAIASAGIRGDLVKNDPELAESAFVAHACAEQNSSGVDLKSAVSCVGIEYAGLDYSLIREKMATSSVIVVDCNLTVEQLVRICSDAEKNDLPVIAGAVSESKVQRIVDAASALRVPFHLVAMNVHEARTLGFSDVDEAGSIANIRRDCGTANLVITRGSNGYIVADREGTTRFANDPIPGVVSTLGAGDALLAAVASNCEHRRAIDWAQCNTDVRTYVNRVLRVPEATPQSTEYKRPRVIKLVQRADFAAAALLVLAAALSVPAMFSPIENPIVFGALLVGTTLAAGASGGLLHWIRQRPTDDKVSANLRPAALGLMAGFLSALSFTLAQMITHGASGIFAERVPANFNLITPFALVISFVAGLTADAVFGRLAEGNALEMNGPGPNSGI